MARFRLRSSFRSKVVLLAVVLVTAIQLLTLAPTLRTVKQGIEEEAERRVALAGRVFDEYMRHRNELLTRVVSAIAFDYPFREAVAADDPKSIESALANHAARANVSVAAVFDLDADHVASIGGGQTLLPGEALERFANAPDDVMPISSIGFVQGQPYYSVSAPIRAPQTIGWVTMALPVDVGFAREIENLTGLKASIVGLANGSKQIYATTLDEAHWSGAIEHLSADQAEQIPSAMNQGDWFTQTRPYREDADGIYVALQLSLADALLPYRELRNQLIGLAAIVLLLTLGTAIWLSRMVTRPVGRLVDAAQRMAEGIYSQPIPISSHDEFAVLAQGFNAMQHAIAKREQDIVHMAHHDSLSGLPAREIIVSEIRDKIADCEQLAIVNFVLHRFDELAASLGHRTADQLIQLVAGRLRDRLEDGQLLGHLNHQEFVIVLPEAGLEEAEDHVRELQATLRAGLAIGNANISLQVRAGVSLYPDHGINASELLRCAGIARGQASHHIGSIGVYKPGQEKRSLELIRIVGDFPRALQRGEISVEFQPKLDCDSLELCGAEALVRWDHPDLGRLPPDRFIGAIEQAGGIAQLTRWVLEQAVETMADWAGQGLVVSMAVNVSADDLIDDYLVPHLKSLSGRFGFVPARLTLEITESAIMRDVDSALAVISAIRGLGCRIAIDDFGTGHSALAQLKRLPVDELKIDKSFVSNISDRRDEAVVRTAIELAQKFGLATVAEGVENDACLARLRQLGCQTAQGFLFSRSRPAGDFLDWARNWSTGRGADIVTLVESRDQPRRIG